VPKPAKPSTLYFASSNPGKLAEYRALADAAVPESAISVDVELLPRFASLPAFEEDAPTFGENALGKALYYSQLTDDILFADDSGLVVPSLGGDPGVHSARYAGPDATNQQRISKLLQELSGKSAAARAAYFCSVIAVAKKGRPVAIVSNRADGRILESSRGNGGFGYDPIFYFPPLGKTFAELSREEKNRHSHRGKAFRRVLALLPRLKTK
jgi:XTP/dITP diphosphohydrolase